MINNNNNEDQKSREEFNKAINIATKQMKDNKILEILSDEVIEKLDETITPLYERAKKAEKLLEKFSFFIKVFTEIGKLIQFKVMLDAQKKEKPNLTI